MKAEVCGKDEREARLPSPAFHPGWTVPARSDPARPRIGLARNAPPSEFAHMRCSRTPFLSSLLLGLLTLLAGCAAEEQTASKSVEPVSFETRFPIRLEGTVVRVQVALRMDEQQRGLMFRESLEPDEGMLFVFSSPRQMSFYMRNTSVPLDIGYLDASGVLREVYPMFPYDERPVLSVSNQIQMALEMRQGWFRDNGIKPGAKLDMAAVRKAMLDRQWDPVRFGLSQQ